MFRDVTFTDVSRAEPVDDASAGFVMDEDTFRAEGASHREIADALGLRPGSLKAMLFRARRRLAALQGGRP